MEKPKKILAIGTGIAFVSLFFTWVSAWIVSVSGFNSDGVFLLAALIYPTIAIFLKKPIHLIGGLISVGIGVMLVMVFLVSIGGEEMAGYGAGPFVALIGLAVMTVAIFKRKNVQTSAMSELSG